jgi:Type II secretion system (T2SS), protein M subtype b
MNSRILPMLALFLAAGIFFFYVNPTWSGSIAETNAAIAVDDQALTAEADYQTQQSALAKQRDNIDPTDLEKLAAFLPDSVDNVGLIVDLNALAARSGLSLSNIDVAVPDQSSRSASQSGAAVALPVSGVSPVGSVNLSLSAVGTFPALLTFLNSVERSERLLDVQDLTVRGSDTGVYTYQMSLRLYWLH